MTTIPFSDYPKEPVVLNNLSEKMMRESRFVPLEIGKDYLRVAMADPGDFYTVESLEMAYGLKVYVNFGKESDILDTIERLHGAGSSVP